MKKNGSKMSIAGVKGELEKYLHSIPPQVHNWSNPPNMVYTCAVTDEQSRLWNEQLLQLEQMNPRDYLTHVLHELSPAELSSLMADEKQRRKTFLVNWPHKNNLSGMKMAQAGFYSLDDGDRVRCVFCEVSLHRWKADDNPMTEHDRSYSFCRFVNGLECGNKRVASLEPDELRLVSRYGPNHNSKNELVLDKESRDKYGISDHSPRKIEYALQPNRWKTFTRWPSHSPVSAQSLCEAGFYYTGSGDQVRCFYCFGGIKEWSANDDPWEEHAWWFPDCTNLINNKSQEFIEKVRARNSANETRTRKVKTRSKVRHDEVNARPGEVERQLRQNSDEMEMDFASDWENEGAQDVARNDKPATLGALQDSEPLQNLSNVGQTLDYFMSCALCKIRECRHIGLPCGHIIYCDSCKAIEDQKARKPEYKPICPKGGKKLSGTMKFFPG